MACRTSCDHDKPVYGHCVFRHCPNYRGWCSQHRHHGTRTSTIEQSRKAMEETSRYLGESRDV